MSTSVLLLGALLAGVAPPPREAPMSLPTFALTSPDGLQVFLAAEDVAEYDWTRHRLTLRPGVKDRLVRQFLGDLATGRPFVVVAEGKRVYEGVFTSSLSSSTQSGVVIDLAPTEDVPDQIDLDLGYPSRAFFRGTDPRDDPAIRQALSRLNKLK